MTKTLRDHITGTIDLEPTQVQSLSIFLMLMIFIYLILFNIFNQLYLGDSGSYIIGFLLGYFLLQIFENNLLFSPYFVVLLFWYPAFENIERGTSTANFIRTMSGVFVASGYILIRFIFSSSKVQLGHVLIYLVAFMLLGKISGLFYEGFHFHDILTSTLGFIALIGLIVVHKQRKNLLNYDL